MLAPGGGSGLACPHLCPLGPALRTNSLLFPSALPSCLGQPLLFLGVVVGLFKMSLALVFAGQQMHWTLWFFWVPVVVWWEGSFPALLLRGASSVPEFLSEAFARPAGCSPAWVSLPSRKGLALVGSLQHRHGPGAVLSRHSSLERVVLVLKILFRACPVAPPCGMPKSGFEHGCPPCAEPVGARMRLVASQDTISWCRSRTRDGRKGNRLALLICRVGMVMWGHRVTRWPGASVVSAICLSAGRHSQLLRSLCYQPEPSLNWCGVGALLPGPRVELLFLA